MMDMLSDDQKAIGQRALKFADEYLEPIVAELDRGLIYPKALVDQLAADDFLGLSLPQYSGVAGAGFISHIEAVQAISQSCPALASILNNHALFAYAISHWATDAQKQHYLLLLAKGEKLGTIAIQEEGPNLGSGPDALLATRQGRGFLLNGTKTFVRSAGAADFYLVFASPQPATGKNEMAAFIVNADLAGLRVGPRLETMGLKCCPVAHLSFTNVAVDESALLGTEKTGRMIASQILSVGSVAEAAQTVGIAKAAVSHAAAYAKRRIQFGHPIAELQAVQTMLAEIATDNHFAWLGVRHAARLIENEAPFGAEAAMVKAFLGRCCSKMLIEAIQVEGGMGISEIVPKHISGSLPLARMCRDIAGTALLDDEFPDKVIAESIA